MKPETMIRGIVFDDPASQPTQRGSFTRVNIEVEVGRDKSEVYPVVFFSGANRAMDLAVGDLVLIPCVVSSREYNGKHYVDLQSADGTIFMGSSGSCDEDADDDRRRPAPRQQQQQQQRPASHGGLKLDMGASSDGGGDQIPF